MNELANIIKAELRKYGRITFARYMDMALYHPELGYYTSGRTEIGRHGDFYTSPHLHPAFGAMMGEQALECWEFMGRPASFDIVEPGAGRGYLANDMLGHLRGSALYDALTYHIIELNPVMRGRQRELLSEHAESVRWHEGYDFEASGMVITNELVDALPVHLVQVNGAFKEIYVTLSGGVLAEEPGELSSPEIAAYMDEFAQGLQDGCRTEVNLEAGRWLSRVAAMLKTGFVLTIDYGYDAANLHAPERRRGTLLCYKGHDTDEMPLDNPGGKDITAHVNFTALARWGAGLGLRPLGYARQGPYLVSLGIHEVLGPDMGLELERVKGLFMPGTMGDTHKVLMQYKGQGEPVLRGFQMKNQVQMLF